MRKTVIAVTFLLVGHCGMAQSGIGLKAGLNLTHITTDAGSWKANINESFETKTGFVFGVWGRLGKNKLYLQPELLVATKGGKVSVAPFGGGTPELIDVKYTNLDIPLLVGFKPLSFLRIMAGPVASFKISEDKKLKDALADYIANASDAFATSTWGYQLGIGIKLLGFEIDLRKEGGLSDISTLSFNNDSKFSQRPSGWQLTLAKKIL
jgi:hypothetical protein